MKYLTSFLSQFSNFQESLVQGTDRTDTSTPSGMDGTPTPAPESPPGVVCDGYGQECVVTLVTDYGRRYCKRCVFPAKARTQKGGARHA